MNNNEIVFSIIVTTYNCDRLLTRCLESLKNISLNNIEIIVIDDCSSNEQIRYIPKVFINQKIFTYRKNNQNLGLGISRNIGIKLARGEYLIFIDGDDYIDVNQFNEFINEYNHFIKDKNIKLIRIGFKRIYQDKTKTFKVKKSQMFNNMDEYINKIFFFSKLKAFSAWSHIYNREFIIQNNLFFKDLYAEDLEHMIRAYQLFNSLNIYISKTYFYCYDNTNYSSITNSKKELIAKDINNFLNINDIKINKLKCFLIIWYYFWYKIKYKKKMKGYFKNLLILLFIYFRKNK